MTKDDVLFLRIIGNQAIIMMALATMIENKDIKNTLKERAEELVGLKEK